MQDAARNIAAERNRIPREMKPNAASIRLTNNPKKLFVVRDVKTNDNKTKARNRRSVVL